MSRTPEIAFLILALVTPASGQDLAPVEGSLAKARALFQRVDLDGDGFLSAAEAGRNKIPGKEFVTFDDDRDRRLSPDEFTLFYRQLLLRVGRPVATDLDAEGARIEATRRTKKAEAGKRGDGGGTEGPPPTDGGSGQAAGRGRDQEGVGNEEGSGEERIARARENAAAKEAERIVQARDQKNQANAGRVAGAREQEEDAQAERIARARAQHEATVAAAEAERIARLREKAEAAEAERVEKARAQDRAPVKKGGPVDDPENAPKTPEERAQAHVKRLLDRGRLTPEQARDFYELLSGHETGPVDAVRAKGLRESLERAKSRLASLVIAGDLSAEEGRQVSMALDARARTLLPQDDADERARSDRGAGSRGVDPEHRRSGRGGRA